MRAPSASVTGFAKNKPPPPPDHTRLQHEFHKEVEYQRRKNRKSCDAFPLRRSIGDESADGESVRAHVSLLRCQILWPEDSLVFSDLRLLNHIRHIFREFFFYIFII